MRYTVVWEEPPEARLAELWMQATDRQAVADASDRIDRALRDDPDKLGVSVGDFRSYADDPLAVLFHVDTGDCKVRVIQVRYTR